jgi:hypothetical protein
MTSTVIQRIDPTRLLQRFAALRWRLRIVTLMAGLASSLAILFSAAIIIAAIDWQFGLPAFVRALALAATLASAMWVFWQRSLRPLARGDNNFALAMRAEGCFPHLQDSLASAVQFLEQDQDDSKISSPLLRRIVIRLAIREADGCDFDRLVDYRSFWRGAACLTVSALALLSLIQWAPQWSRIVAQRLAAPYGVSAFPSRTKIRFVSPAKFPHQQAVGIPLMIEAEINGVVPERAQVSLLAEGIPATEQTWLIERKGDGAGSLIVRIEGSRIVRSMRIRLQVNDADTGWLEIHVSHPPDFAPIEGKPSPQIRLEYPAYTDLPARQLPFGATSWDAVVGTTVQFHAAVSHPVVRCSMQYRPESPTPLAAAACCSLASTNSLQLLGIAAITREATDPIPITLSDDGKLIASRFVPRLSGAYAIQFEDAEGFGMARTLHATVTPDPAPVVELRRPNAGQDSLYVTPDADLPLLVDVSDDFLAIRSISLLSSTQPDAAPNVRSYFDAEHMAYAWPKLLSQVSGGAVGPIIPIKLRLKRVMPDGRLRLAEFRKPDGSQLREGDVLTIQFVADDFDDVSYVKEPGRSRLLELHIVSPQTLEDRLKRDQGRLRLELLKLQQWQQEAHSKVTEVLEHRDSEKLSNEDRERLLQAEQLQEQIRNRVGNERDGLRAEVARLIQAQQDNHLSFAADRERLLGLASELERFAREELEPIEPLLSAAREASEGSKDGKTPKDALKDAERRQQDSAKTISAMLQRLEPWSGANEIRGETRSLLADLEQLRSQTEQLAKEMPSGASRERLTPQQQENLEKVATKQESLANQARQLLEKMERLASEKRRQARERLEEATQLDSAALQADERAEQAADPQEKGSQRAAALKLREQADERRDAAAIVQQEENALQRAADRGRDQLQKEPNANASRSPTKLDDAARNVRENRLGQAQEQQQQAAAALREMLEELEERRQDDLDRLRRKMKQAEDRLNDLADRQERLQKKVKDVERLTDPAERQQALERLAREQEALRQEAREIAQDLSRNQAGEAGKSLSRAAREMAESRKQLERGENGNSSQDEAIQKIDEALDQLDKSREKIEEELLREKLAKVSNRIQGIRERQKAAIDESHRLHSFAKTAKKWERDKLLSLIGLQENEERLADELNGLVEKRFRQDRVLAKILDHAIVSMRQAASSIQQRADEIKNCADDEPFDLEQEEQSQQVTLNHQHAALRRLDQLLDSLKPDKELAKSANSGPKKQTDGSGSASSNRESDAFPPLAQIRALRMLQAEVTERTERFAKEHPDPARLTDIAKKELQALQTLQKDVAELIIEFMPAEKPGEGQ